MAPLGGGSTAVSWAASVGQRGSASRRCRSAHRRQLVIPGTTRGPTTPVWPRTAATRCGTPLRWTPATRGSEAAQARARTTRSADEVAGRRPEVGEGTDPADGVGCGERTRPPLVGRAEPADHRVTGGGDPRVPDAHPPDPAGREHRGERRADAGRAVDDDHGGTTGSPARPGGGQRPGELGRRPGRRGRTRVRGEQVGRVEIEEEARRAQPLEHLGRRGGVQPVPRGIGQHRPLSPPAVQAAQQRVHADVGR